MEECSSKSQNCSSPLIIRFKCASSLLPLYQALFLLFELTLAVTLVTLQINEHLLLALDLQLDANVGTN